MTNFIFKSDKSDLQKISQSILTLNKNVLYITYRVDMLVKRFNQQDTDKGLQKQVDDYFDDSEDIPEKETPPEEVDHLWVLS